MKEVLRSVQHHGPVDKRRPADNPSALRAQGARPCTSKQGGSAGRSAGLQGDHGREGLPSRTRASPQGSKGQAAQHQGLPASSRQSPRNPPTHQSTSGWQRPRVPTETGTLGTQEGTTAPTQDRPITCSLCSSHSQSAEKTAALKKSAKDREREGAGRHRGPLLQMKSGEHLHRSFRAWPSCAAGQGSCCSVPEPKTKTAQWLQGAATQSQSWGGSAVTPATEVLRIAFPLPAACTKTSL